MDPVNVFELEAIARERLSPDAYDYYVGGALDEVTLRANRAGYGRLSLAYRVLVDVSRRDPATTVLGQPVAMPDLLDPSLSWADVAWLRSLTPLPLLIKGIVRPDDALRAADSGVAGVVVSNHGGRQLDTAPATIEVLPEIAAALDAAGHRIEIFLDGGVRRGTDVLKALALGARAVLVGRPVLWGLAADGEAGVAWVLRHLRAELDLAMALAGAPTITDITRDLVRRQGGAG